MDQRALLIEDEPNIVEAIRFLLSRDGWSVDTHADGTTALEAVRERMPAVVILDVMLPGKSGVEVLRDMRADPATAAIPVLVLTAKGQESDRAEAERAGASRFMTKPFANAEMREAVRALIGR